MRYSKSMFCQAADKESPPDPNQASALALWASAGRSVLCVLFDGLFDLLVLLSAMHGLGHCPLQVPLPAARH